jgi:hypothetical protein
MDHGLDDLVDVGRSQADRDGVHSPELLEQHRLALHDGHRGCGPDVAETEHGSAVSDDGDGVGDPGVLVGQARVLGDRLAHARHTRGVGHRELLRAIQRHPGGDLHLAAGVQREDRIVGARVLQIWHLL